MTNPPDPLTAAQEAVDAADQAVAYATKMIEALPDREPEAFPLANRLSELVQGWRVKIRDLRADALARYRKATDESLADLAKRYGYRGRGTVQDLIDRARQRDGGKP